MQLSLSLRGATVVLDDRAILRNVSLDVGPGLTVVRGANGAGKTTLLRALAGLLPLAHGSRAASESPVLVGHRVSMLRALSPSENLSFFCAYQGLPRGRVSAALERWGIAAEADRPLERLSAGQRKRASLARLDALDARIAILDEPFGDLDDEGVALVRAALARWRDEGRAVVVATHGHDELDATAAVHHIEHSELRTG